MTSSTENKIKDVLQALMAGINKEEESLGNSLRDLEGMEEVFEALKLNDPELFYFRLAYPVKQAISGVVRSHFKVEMTEQLVTIFTLYDYLENHLTKLFTTFEGSPCSRDKAKTVLRSLVTYYLTGKKINWNYSQEYTYGLPKTILVTHESIEELYTALISLYHGNPASYLTCYKTFLSRSGD